jgi:hypothetical protein
MWYLSIKNIALTLQMQISTLMGMKQMKKMFLLIKIPTSYILYKITFEKKKINLNTNVIFFSFILDDKKNT